MVQDALAFTQFQWHALASHEQHVQEAVRNKFQAAQRKLVDECDDLRNENRLLAEKSRRVLQQVGRWVMRCWCWCWSRCWCCALVRMVLVARGWCCWRW